VHETNREFENWNEYCSKFRVGDFKDASETIKKAWIYYCDRFLPATNRSWLDETVRANTLMGDVVTISDEAYTILILEKNLDVWIIKKLPGVMVKREKKRYSDEISVTMNADSQSQQSSITADASFLQNAETEQNESNEKGTHAKIFSREEMEAAKLACESEKKRCLIEEKKNELRYFALFDIVKKARASDQSRSWEIGYQDFITGKVIEQTKEKKHGESLADDEDDNPEESGNGVEIEGWDC
jgi:hypothetical protein